MMLWTLLQVAIGGAVGASARYLTGVGVLRLVGFQAIPLGVMVANVLGSFAMGALVVYLGQRGLGHLNALLMTGFLGGYTTFSAFSLETWTLFERGQMGLVAAYVLMSVGLSLLGLALGVVLMRAALA